MAKAIASSIATIEHMTAVVDALLLTIATIDIGIVLVQLPDFAPPEALPYLAQQYGVDGIRGYNLCSTDDQRRDLIKRAIDLHRTKGTPYSIKRAITALGYNSVTIREHTGLNYDGVYNFDGSKTYGGGHWYNFSVEVFYSGDAPADSQISLIRQLIDEYKNVRSVLFDLKFTQQ